jgi:hypothetical protein
LEQHFGGSRVINAWGGHSKATTAVLDALQYRGLLRVARREKGIRVYSAVPGAFDSIDPVERSRKLILLLTKILATVMEKNLRFITALKAA